MAKSNKAKSGPGAPKAELIKRILRENARRYLPQYLLAFALMAVVAGMTGAAAWILKSVINDIFIARDKTLIWVVALSVLAIYTMRGMADYASVLVMNRIGRDLVADQQKRLYVHLVRQGMDFYNSTSLGEIVTRVSHSAMSIRTVMDLIITSLGRDLLSVISLSVVMIMQDPTLSLFAIVIFPLALLGLRRLVKRIREMGQAEYAGIARIVSGLKDTVLGIRVVKSFGMEDRLVHDMDRTIEATAKRGFRIANLSARSGPLMESLAGLAVACIILYAGYGVVNEQRDAGSLFAFLAALLFAYEPAKKLASLHLKLETALIGAGMIYDFLDQPLTMQNKPDAPPLVLREGEVELRNVTFSYGKKTSALNDLSLLFPASKVSALVGPSGAGKSTIFALVERFYDPQQGEVLIDGQNVRDVSMESLRSQMAFVTQETFLFEGTIGDNILAGRPGATPDEIIAAAKAANAHEFIAAFPEGYGREVGEAGANLSGGQRQRIAIARAMLRNAPILLLDEATSSLDAQSEAKVKEALDTLMKGRTTIVIAHRLSTVRNADVIHVIDKGRVIESGTHEVLVRQGGSYAQLCALQFAADAKAGAPAALAAVSG